MASVFAARMFCCPVSGRPLEPAASAPGPCLPRCTRTHTVPHSRSGPTESGRKNDHVLERYTVY